MNRKRYCAFVLLLKILFLASIALVVCTYSSWKTEVSEEQTRIDTLKAESTALTDDLAFHESQFALPMSITEEDIVELPGSGKDWFNKGCIDQIKTSLVAILGQDIDWVTARDQIEIAAHFMHTPESYVYTFDKRTA